MTTIVVMPGGFHPFHAGHAALYQSARRTFPDAEVYVAATNDTSARPFPFAVKEKLAKLAGVEPGHFVQVKSPFRAEEITSKFDPNKDQLIFVRSEKDSTKPPQPGGVKKDGSPSYLQPLLGAKRLEPFAKHAYMAYLPTVEFGPGMTSATEIRTAWPTLNEKRKTALVMSLYPKTQGNPKLAATVVGLLDAAIGTQGVAEGMAGMDDAEPYTIGGAVDKQYVYTVKRDGKSMGIYHSLDDAKSIVANNKRTNKYSEFKIMRKPRSKMAGPVGQLPEQGVEENQGWAATYTNEETRAYGGQQGAGMTAAYQRRENQPVDEDYVEEKWSERYKRSIDCSNPKGFSQRAHCAGRKK